MDIRRPYVNGNHTITMEVSFIYKFVRHHITKNICYGKLFELSLYHGTANDVSEHFKGIELNNPFVKDIDSDISHEAYFAISSDPVFYVNSIHLTHIPPYIEKSDIVNIPKPHSEKVALLYRNAVHVDIAVNVVKRHIIERISMPPEVLILLASIKHFYSLSILGELETPAQLLFL